MRFAYRSRLRRVVRWLQTHACGWFTGHARRSRPEFIIQDYELRRRHILWEECAICGWVHYVSEEAPLETLLEMGEERLMRHTTTMRTLLEVRLKAQR